MKYRNADQISVIIPTHNRADRLDTALRSVLEQTLLPAEILVIDDGSIDDTEHRVAVLGRTAAVHLVYLRQPNRGPAAARNLGIARASFDLLAFLDSDDCWQPRKLEIQAHALRSSPSYLVSHTREIWYKRGRPINQKKRHCPPHGFIFDQCLSLCCVGMSTVMAHRSLFHEVGMFDEALPCCEDYDLWLRVAASRPFLLVDLPLTVKHGGRPDQVSVTYRQRMDRFRIQALAKQLGISRLTTVQRLQLGRELIRKCGIYGTGCGKHGRPEEERHYQQLADWAMQRMNGDDGEA
ncbi:MAG: glycosyltransferase family 2 protein [Desulfofustis sp.]|nr:glycosyltransferase family 2 protein [Desulfofustis sp.]